MGGGGGSVWKSLLKQWKWGGDQCMEEPAETVCVCGGGGGGGGRSVYGGAF